MTKAILTVLGFVFSFGSSSFADPLYTLTGLGTLGGSFSYAEAINSSGQVAGSSELANGSVHGFMYDGSMHDLGTLGGDDSYAEAINSSGQVVGSAFNYKNIRHAFLYSGNQMQDIDSKTAESASIATSISDDTHIVGYATVNGISHAFLYTYAGAMQNLAPDLYTSFANGINNSHDVVGSAVVGGLDHAYLYDGSLQTLGTIGDNTNPSVGTQVNSSDQISGYVYIDGIHHAILYDGSMHDLGTLGGYGSWAFAINDFGIVVGWASIANGDQHAFVYRDGKMEDLNNDIDPCCGWVLQQARGINNSGQITGYGLNSQGLMEAFILSPIPEPSTLLLIMVFPLVMTKRRTI